MSLELLANNKKNINEKNEDVVKFKLKLKYEENWEQLGW